MVDPRGPIGQRVYPAQRHPVFWYEKISVLVFASWLTDRGYEVGLSVRPSDIDRPSSGVPWRDRLADATDLAWHDLLHDAGRRRLGKLVEANPALRYDGIWHDTQGGIDIVAWGSTETLVVEAKGAVGAGVAKEAMSAIGRIALEMISGRPDLAYGVLFPDDESDDNGKTRSSGYVRTLARETVPASILVEEGLRVYLVGSEGAVRETRLDTLAARDLPGLLPWAQPAAADR